MNSAQKHPFKAKTNLGIANHHKTEKVDSTPIARPLDWRYAGKCTYCLESYYVKNGKCTKCGKER